MGSDRDKSEQRSKITQQVKHIPKDAQVIMSIMKELGITEYEPRVINQLLEFTYRYVTCIMDDAKIYANHAKKKVIDLDDVKLASAMLMDKQFTSPPSRDVLLELARGRNMTPLPLIKPHCGLRLPPDRYCLVGMNYKLRSIQQSKKLNKSILDSVGRTGVKGSKVTVGTVKSKFQTTPKTQSVQIPKPVFKVSQQSTPNSQPQSSSVMSTSIPARVTVKSEIKVEAIDEDGGGSAAKRKREDDDFVMI